MVDWLDRLDAELDNLGSALEWGLEAEPWAAVRMATALLPYWAVRVMSQDNDARIVAAIEIARARVVGRPDADPADQALAARLLGEAARLWAMSGRAIDRARVGRGGHGPRRRERRPRSAAGRCRRPGDRDGLLGQGRARRYGRAADLRARPQTSPSRAASGGSCRCPRRSPAPASVRSSRRPARP